MFFYLFSFLFRSITLPTGLGIEDHYNYLIASISNDENMTGRRYDSSSGHAFIFGGRIKGIVGMVLYSKACCKCDAEEKRGEEAEEQECPKNF